MSGLPADYREMFDHAWLKCVHLHGQEHRVRISRVEAGEVVGDAGRKSRKPVLTLDWRQGTADEIRKLPFAISRTDGKTIAGMYGTDPRAWVGKEIILFPTTTQLGGKTVECIRVRPTIPRQLTPKQREPGEDG